MEPEIKQLLSELKIAEIMYRKISLRLTDQLVKDQMAALTGKKLRFIQDLGRQYDEDMERLHFELSDMIRSECEKQEIVLDQLILRGSEEEIIENCIRKEKRALNIYKRQVEGQNNDDFMTALLASQLAETYNFIQELEGTQIAYNTSITS